MLRLDSTKTIQESGAIHDYPIFNCRVSTPSGIKYGSVNCSTAGCIMWYEYNPTGAFIFPIFPLPVCEVSRFTIVGIERKCAFSDNYRRCFSLSASANIQLFFNLFASHFLTTKKETPRKVSPIQYYYSRKRPTCSPDVCALGLAPSAVLRCRHPCGAVQSRCFHLSRPHPLQCGHQL